MIEIHMLPWNQSFRELGPHAALVHDQLDAAELQRMTLHRDGRRWEE